MVEVKSEPREPFETNLRSKIQESNAGFHYTPHCKRAVCPVERGGGPARKRRPMPGKTACPSVGPAFRLSALKGGEGRAHDTHAVRLARCPFVMPRSDSTRGRSIGCGQIARRLAPNRTDRGAAAEIQSCREEANHRQKQRVFNNILPAVVSPETFMPHGTPHARQPGWLAIPILLKYRSPRQ
jgi:hypothetical protein